MSNVTDQFTHNHRIYDLAKLRILMRPYKTTFFPTDKLLWVLKWDHPQEERVQKAKFRWPLFITKDGNRYVVIDGLHRLERARRLKLGIVPVKDVPPDILKQCLVTHS